MERDKFLTEAMGGSEAHMLCHPVDILSCVCVWGTKTCAVKHYDFSTWTGFGKLFEWAQEQEWLEDFLNIMDVGEYIKCPDGNDTFDIQKEFINPARFADAVYEFLNSEEGKRR